ncbi:MAG: glycosyltransferase family 39 protein [Nitrospirae bacterium]|nr:glycosyltransferase family 39 protein [Nitrospirota bacterium]
MSQDERGAHLVLLLALSGLLFFLGLGSLGLTDRDEGSNAEAAREMVETGDWISPTLNYQPRFAKPVFIYWLMSGAYTLFGASEFTARLPSALFGVALIALQYLFLSRLRGPAVGLFGALMLLLNLEIVAIGRMALTDSVLIFFTTLSLYGFWLGLHGEGRERHYIWLLYVGMALGTLTKGPVGIAVPLLAIVPYLTLTGRWGQFWRTGFPLAGLLVLLLLAVPWYAAMLAIHGSQYTASAQADTVGRFLNVLGGHGGTLFFYVPVLLFGFFPWSGFLVVGLYQTFKDWRAARGTKLEDSGLSGSSGFSGSTKETKQTRQTQVSVARLPAPQELELFAALWVAAVFVFFSLSATRLPHYIAPLFPAAAILAASYWHRSLSNPAVPGRRAAVHVTMGLGYLLGVALAATPALYDKFLDVIVKEFPVATQVTPGFGAVAAGLTLVIGCGMVGYFGLSDKRRAGAFWAAGATIAIVMLLAIQVVLPRFNAYFVAPPHELAYAAGVNLGPDDRLILYGPARPSLIFYAKRKAIVIRPGEEEKMRPHLTQPGRTMIVLPARLRPQLPAETENYVTLLERYGYSLLASEPMVKLPANLPPPPVIDPEKDPHARYKQ